MQQSTPFFVSLVDLSHAQFTEAFAQLPFVSDPDVVLHGKASPSTGPDPDPSAPPPGGLASRTVVACEACHRAKACCQNERPCRRCVRLNKGQCRDRVVKERKTTVACVNCWKAKSGCDSNRPCSRCVRLGKESECVDRTHKKSGRPRKDQSAAAKASASAAASATGGSTTSTTAATVSPKFVPSAYPPPAPHAEESSRSSSSSSSSTPRARGGAVPKLEESRGAPLQNACSVASSSSNSGESSGSFAVSPSSSGADSSPNFPYIDGSVSRGFAAPTSSPGGGMTNLGSTESSSAYSADGFANASNRGSRLEPKVEESSSMQSASRRFSDFADSSSGAPYDSPPPLGMHHDHESLTDGFTSGSGTSDSRPNSRYSDQDSSQRFASRWPSKRKYSAGDVANYDHHGAAEGQFGENSHFDGSAASQSSFAGESAPSESMGFANSGDTYSSSPSAAFGHFDQGREQLGASSKRRRT